MDVREAVSVAKSYLANVYTDEGIVNLGLEEVEFDENAGTWCVTLGFSRPWDHPPMPPRNNALAAALGEPTQPELRRSYKVLRIDNGDGQVESLRDGILTPATP